jgi:alkyldihydroxyacetonephosphate synthase
MGAMRRVLELDDVSRVVTVQAGITGPELSSYLEAAGSMIGHQPQSQSISTVGGWVATRACGQLSARYGGVEDILAGLEAVLPGGRVVRSKVVPRRAAGPDVASLMIGSEGTLGVVTEATLRIVPVPDARADLCARFEHMSDAVAGCRALAQSELGPSLVRLYDRDDALVFFRELEGAPAGPLLLASFEGREGTARVEDAAALIGGVREDPGLVSYWWGHRNDAVDEYARMMSGNGILGPHALVDTMEVAGTWTVLRDLYHRMREALTPLADHVGCHLSHVYPDGACLYFTLASACSDDDHAQRTDDAWWAAGMSTCLESGGTISHHHGIGRLKARWLPDEVGGWWDVLRAVKAAVDPNRIMNPGALGL